MSAHAAGGAGAGNDEGAKVSSVADGGNDMSTATCTRNDVQAFMMRTLADALQVSTKQFPTNGCLSGASEDDYYIIPPLSSPNGVATCVYKGQWCTFVGPRQQGKTTCMAYLIDCLGRSGAYACLATFTLGKARSATSGDALLHTLLSTATSSNDSPLWSTPEELAAWLVNRINRADPTYLFLDEYDLLAEASPRVQAEFLSQLISYKGSAPFVVVAAGNTCALRLSGMQGSPFNTTVAVAAPPFSLKEVTKLLAMAAADSQFAEDVVTEAALVIHNYCQGHRGMVCHFAEAMRQHYVQHGTDAAFDMGAYKDTMVLEILAKPLVTCFRETLRRLDSDTGKPLVVSSVVAAAVLEAKVARPSAPGTIRDAIDVVADCGFLVTNDNVMFAVTSPLFRAMLREILAERSDKPLQLATTEDDTVDFCATLLTCIANISAQSFAASSKICVKDRGQPKEALYTLELGVLLKILQRQSTGLVVVPEATVKADESTTVSIDFVVQRDGESFVLEVCAHERAGPATRRGTVAEHYVRVAEKYHSAAGTAVKAFKDTVSGGDEDDGGDEDEDGVEEPPGRYCWLVDFSSWKRCTSHPRKVASAVGLAVGGVPTINVLLVFHTMDWQRVGYTLWKQGVALDENFPLVQPLIAPAAPA